MDIINGSRLLKYTEVLEYSLKGGLRPDGRTPGEAREAAISSGFIGTANGSGCMKLDRTSAVCGIKVELSKVPLSYTKGNFSCKVQFPAVCSVNSRKGQIQQTDICNSIELLISELIEPGIINLPGTEKPLIKLEDLRILDTNWVWNLDANVLCTSYDGNATDVCIGAFVAALKSLELPAVVVNKDDGKPLIDENGPRTGLALNSHPFSTTFALYDQILLMDPTGLEEEALFGNSLTIISDGKEPIKVSKSGGSISATKLREAINIANIRQATLFQLMMDNGESIDK
ncbi:hypothetical protein QYM36_010229 [Artemia franciscana]|uniref:Ribosomal RNA-processing protein 43 n=1 Tax=Artemia franciscana TaxID=6661 RepID=A0AA88L1J8_ARTSF|nr:hypothetical protein QYM36_010229 [Artemia franciscana]